MGLAICQKCLGRANGDTFEEAKSKIDHSIGLTNGRPCPNDGTNLVLPEGDFGTAEDKPTTKWDANGTTSTQLPMTTVSTSATITYPQHTGPAKPKSSKPSKPHKQ